MDVVVRKYGLRTQYEFGNRDYEVVSLGNLDIPLGLLQKGNSMALPENGFNPCEIFDVCIFPTRNKIIVSVWMK